MSTVRILIDAGTGRRPNLPRETKFSGKNGDREKNSFPHGSADHEQNWIGNLTWLIHTLLYTKYIISDGVT